MKVLYRKKFLKELSKIPPEIRKNIEKFVFEEIPKRDLQVFPIIIRYFNTYAIMRYSGREHDHLFTSAIHSSCQEFLEQVLSLSPGTIWAMRNFRSLLESLSFIQAKVF